MFVAETKVYVSHVEAGGLVDTKNSMLADVPNSVLQPQTLQLGDVIVAVNGVVDPGGILDELASPHQHTLHVWVVRWHGGCRVPSELTPVAGTS